MREREFHPESVRSILLIRLYFLGDVLLSTPVIGALKDRFPDAKLSVLIKKRALNILVGNPAVDEVIIYDEPKRYHSPVWQLTLASRLRRARYDLAVDLTGDLRSSLLLLAAEPGFRIGVNHAGLGCLLDRRIPYRSSGPVVDHLLSVLLPLGIDTGEGAPSLYLTEEERNRARDLLKSRGIAAGERFVMLSPGAGSRLKRWEPERFGSLAKQIKRGLGLSSIVTGATGDRDLADAVVASSGGTAVSLAGATDVRLLAAVAAEAEIFVGNDSGPMHITASQGTPVVGLFGASTPERFTPRGAPSRVIWHRFDCSPCDQRRCERPGESCMNAIGVEEVLRAVTELLSEVGTTRATECVARSTGGDEPSDNTGERQV
jgi:predicted lipopolysaccharide heptosyltransferase III